MDYSYNTSYGDYDTLLSGIFAGSMILLLILLLIAVVAYVFYVIGLWKVFKKAGKGGWEAIIPFYNVWVLVEISGLNWWWFLIIISTNIVSILGLEDLVWIANIANLFASFNCYFNLSKKFNKSVGYAICLTLFTPITIAILGLSKNNVYNSSVAVSKNGCIGSPDSGNANQGQYSQSMNANQSFSNVDNSNDVTNNNGSQTDYSFCANCGTKIVKDSSFCPNCGKENI